MQDEWYKVIYIHRKRLCVTGICLTSFVTFCWAPPGFHMIAGGIQQPLLPEQTAGSPAPPIDHKPNEFTQKCIKGSSNKNKKILQTKTNK